MYGQVAEASEHGNEARGTGIAEDYWILKEKSDIRISCGDDRVVANSFGFNGWKDSEELSPA